MKIENTDETMQSSAQSLAQAVVGHRIVSVEKSVKIPRPKGSFYWGSSYGTEIVLDNGKRVFLADTDDCCAYTELESFFLNVDKIDHIITGVGTTDDYSKWHIYADLDDVLGLDVGWSEGSGYYGYGFDIVVVDPEAAEVAA